MAPMRVEAKINTTVASKNGKAIHDKVHGTLMVSFSGTFILKRDPKKQLLNAENSRLLTSGLNSKHKLHSSSLSFESYTPKILYATRGKMKCKVNEQRNMERLKVKTV